MTLDDLVEKLAGDPKIVEIVRRSTLHEHPSWLACPGGESACRDVLFVCLSCWNAGCSGATSCPQRLFDEQKTCLHCGETTTFSRTLKLSAVALRRVWERSTA